VLRFNDGPPSNELPSQTFFATLASKFFSSPDEMTPQKATLCHDPLKENRLRELTQHQPLSKMALRSTTNQTVPLSTSSKTSENLEVSPPCQASPPLK
jgi:hypothetical protein